MNVLKQVVGIDVAMGELVNFSGLAEDLKIGLRSTDVFKNSENGFVKLGKWVGKHASADIEVLFVMEATGVYHEKLAHWLHGKSKKVAVVLPNKISNYARTLDIKTVTDKTAAGAIARFGLERNLDTWEPPREVFMKIKQLTRERDQIVAERTVIKKPVACRELGGIPKQEFDKTAEFQTKTAQQAGK